MLTNTSLVKISVKTTPSPTLPSADGAVKIKLKLSGPLVATDATPKKTSKLSLKRPKLSPIPEEKSAMPESVPPIKKQTLKDKQQTSNLPSLTTKSSKKLDRDSTTTADTFKPFWKECTVEMSERLPLPTKTDSVDTASNSWTSSYEKLSANSWFSTTSQRVRGKAPKRLRDQNSATTSSVWSTTLWQKTMECGRQLSEEHEKKWEEAMKKQIRANERKRRPKEGQPPAPKVPAGKAKKVRVFPTEEQNQKLKRWMGTVRWTYNKILADVKEGRLARNQKSIREKWINEDGLKKEYSWALETPHDVRDEAMRDLLKNYNNNFARLKKKKKKEPDKEHHFEMHFKGKKDDTHSLTILAKHWKRAGVFHPDMFGQEPLKASEPLPDKLDYTVRLIRMRDGKYYLAIPQPLDVRGDNQAPLFKMEEESIVAMDPGVRTFMTTYSADGIVTEWGKADMTRIYRLCRAVDLLQSKWSQKEVKHKKRYKMKRAALRIRRKIKDLVTEVHRKLAKFLVENYRLVLLPKFETKQMVRRGARRINSQTARKMLTWSHYKFQQRLIAKSREYPWCKVAIVDEHYTSKTCGSCGKLHHKLKGKKEFKCPYCKVVMDRDMNGARNILLRFLTLRVVSCEGERRENCERKTKAERKKTRKVDPIMEEDFSDLDDFVTLGGKKVEHKKKRSKKESHVISDDHGVGAYPHGGAY